MSRRRVAIVGVGLDPAGRQVTLEVLESIKRAGVVFVTRATEKIVRTINPSAHIEYISTREATMDFSRLADRIYEVNDDVIVAVRGDSTFASLGTRLYRELTRRGVECVLIPGISSLQVAAARLGVDWSNSLVLDVHACPSDRMLRLIASSVLMGLKVITTLHPRLRGEDIARFLLESGMSDLRMSICENLGKENERLVTGSASDIARAITNYNAIAVIESMNDVRWESIRDSDLVTCESIPGPTKEEIRAVTATKARIRPGFKVLEVGCGTGALTIELALRVAPDGVVYALDYREEAIRTAMINLRKARLAHLVRLIRGKAPESLENINDTFNVAVIGGTENLESTLMIVYRKLDDPGRIVINAVTVDTVIKSYNVLRDLGLAVEITTCYVARTREIKGKLVFTAQNPVFIITGERKR